MSDRPVPPIDLAHAAVTYFEGAHAHALGALLSNETTVNNGMAMIRRALAVIDASDIGRAVLIPFLSHAHPMVRCEAAKSLHATHRELATPVLLDLNLSDVTEASQVAGIFLVFAGEPHWGGEALAEHYPYRYDDTLHLESLKRFEEEARLRAR